jgi:N-acetylneuraminic acid mutarotase
MHRKACYLLVAAASLALIFIVGAPMVSASSPSTHASAPTSHKPSGLTRHSVKNAMEEGLPGEFSRMASQSNLALLQHATKLGPHAQDAEIELTVALRLRNVAKLKSFLQQVQNPYSAVYHQWLTPAEFTSLYGPTKADVARLKDFLALYGIRVKNVSSNRMLMHTVASTAKYERAFGIRINDYKLDGRRFYSTKNAPRLPRALAPLVANVLGLNHGVQMQPHSFIRPLPRASAHDVQSHQALQAPPPSLTYYSPLQIAHAYNYPDITDPANGAGVNIAIVTAASSGLENRPDPHDFWAAFGLPDHTINVIPVKGDDGDQAGMGETLLDVEYAGAMGPGATLNVYVAADPSFDTMVAAYNEFTNDTNSDGTVRNQVMTTSWGTNEVAWAGYKEVLEASEQIYMQATAEGISMFAAAGDNGSSDGIGGADGNLADYPSSSPYITASNGTQLSISSLAGDYGGEVVWNDADCFGQGIRQATGGAVSKLFDRPEWQRGAGLPPDIDTRMNSDMAATASCSKPMIILVDGWSVVAGTSAVAPQFAGMFSIAVAQKGKALGLANTLIYNAANTYNYSIDFHDVTEGNNGAFQAGPGWDHPTGWGSPNVGNFLAHLGKSFPEGTLSGAVTDAASGETVGGARITVTGSDGREYTASAADDGTYSLLLPPAENFMVSVSKFGYADSTASASIEEGTTTTLDFALEASPTYTLSGKVSDHSGHGYGLYADIKVFTEGFGQVAEVWTDPGTGQYNVKLPRDVAYTLKVAAAFNGYDSGAETVMLSSDKTLDFALAVNVACTAPGYYYKQGGFGEDFNGPTFPPAGWTVTNENPDPDSVFWKSTAQRNQRNITGGTGNAASTKQSITYGEEFYLGMLDTSLITAPISVSTLQGTSMLSFKANFDTVGLGQVDLDISTDGGNTWSVVKSWKDPIFPATTVRADLASHLPASGDFQLRWHNRGSNALHSQAQIDDVSIGDCVPASGGILYGVVTDATTGEGITGAEVSDDLGAGVKTLATDFDPALPDGFYLYFAQPGEHTLTVEKRAYAPQSVTVNLANDQVVQENVSLKSARFDAEPQAFTLHVKAGEATTASFALSNTGVGTGHFDVMGMNAPAPMGTSPVPVRRTPLKHPEWLREGLTGFLKLVQANALQPPYEARGVTAHDVRPNAAPWMDLADYPVDVGFNLLAFDARSGKLYGVGGLSRSTSSNLGGAYVYDPDANTWSPIADMSTPRAGMVGGFINGKLYVTAGVSLVSGPTTATEIYDPATDTWTVGAPMPMAVGTAASAAVLNGKLYVVGGQGASGAIDTVYVYDPAQDEWGTAADYPHAAVFTACGTIAGKIYCVGGANTIEKNYEDGYVYDPAEDKWWPIADFPILGGVQGALYGTTGGQLLVAGGFIVNSAFDAVVSEATNQVFAYDPVTDSWKTLPNLNDPVAVGGSSCAGDGFYTAGSVTADRGVLYGGIFLTNATQKLPGYSCMGTGIPWLTIAPPEGTLAPGATARVTLEIDGSDQKEYTTSEAFLWIGETPYPTVVPITIHWDPHAVNLGVLGNVGPTGAVDKGDTLTYSITVQNSAEAEGAASQVELVYAMPEGVNFLASNGASCKGPPAGSSSSAIPAAVAGPATIACDLGTIEPDTGKLVSLAVQAATSAEAISAEFKASAREPDSDTSDNSLTLSTNPAVGPVGPEGPEGPKGDKGSGGLAFGGLAFLALLILLVGAIETRKRGERVRQR